jgi:hypothetical protein
VGANQDALPGPLQDDKVMEAPVVRSVSGQLDAVFGVDGGGSRGRPLFLRDVLGFEFGHGVEAVENPGDR